MSYAEALEAALARGAIGGLAEQYLHRARRETCFGTLVGRDAITAEDLKLAATIEPEVSVRVRSCSPSLSIVEIDRPDGSRERQHRWLAREGERVVRETVVGAYGGATEGELHALAAQAPLHPPLGEVRSGRGQLAAGATSWFSDGPGWLLDALHRIWNGRRFDEIERLYAPGATWSGPDAQSGGPALFRSWIMRLLARHPDATLLFERAEEVGDSVALLWRLIVHQDGRRCHMLGSSLMAVADGRVIEDETVLDLAALEFLAGRPLLAIAR